jgi:heterodisulfide reductase subunit B
VTELAYYPGCSLHSTATELDSSFDGTMSSLGVNLLEIPDWECCGNTAGHSTNRLLAAALPANELAKVKDDMKLDAVAVPCAACFSRFQTANHEVTDQAMAADVAEVVGRPYEGGVKVLNMVDVYHDQVGLEELKAKVVKPFQGLKVASYYGCLLTRPPKVTLAEDPEYPVHMDAVVEAIGCTPVEWDSKTDCCGASLALAELRIVDNLVKKIILNARERGAEAIACACPLCQINLDTRQVEITKTDDAWVDMPILYLSQMVGRALGVSDKQLGLKKAMVDVQGVLSCASRTSAPGPVPTGRSAPQP